VALDYVARQRTPPRPKDKGLGWSLYRRPNEGVRASTIYRGTDADHLRQQYKPLAAGGKRGGTWHESSAERRHPRKHRRTVPSGANIIWPLGQVVHRTWPSRTTLIGDRPEMPANAPNLDNLPPINPAKTAAGAVAGAVTGVPGLGLAAGVIAGDNRGGRGMTAPGGTTAGPRMGGGPPAGSGGAGDAGSGGSNGAGGGGGASGGSDIGSARGKIAQGDKKAQQGMQQLAQSKKTFEDALRLFEAAARDSNQPQAKESAQRMRAILKQLDEARGAAGGAAKGFVGVGQRL
jgi:hypothetical protein